MTGLTAQQRAIAEELGILVQNSIAQTQKAATPITTTQLQDAAGVGLNQEIPSEFIDLVVDESVLLKRARGYRTRFRTGDLAKLDVQRYITESAEENGTSTETRAHTPGSVHYLNRKIRSQYDITGEAEEDNIEGPSGVNTILAALMKQVANDIETLGIEGDESVVGSDDYSRLVRSNDGWHVLTSAGTGTHIKNAGAKQVSWKLLSDMVKMLPTRYRGGNWQSRYAFVMSPNTHICLLDEFINRETGVGDAIWGGGANGLRPLGIPLVEVPLIPENLTVTGTDSTGTFIWLVDLRNFIYVIQRAIRMHREFIPRYDRMEFTVFQRCDFIIENTDAIVKATNVLVDPAAARYGA